MGAPWEDYAPAPAAPPAADGPWNDYKAATPAPKAAPVSAPAPKPAATPLTPLEGMKGAVETALSMGTGALAKVGGGLVGVYKGLTGSTPEDAADAVTQFQQAATYQPRSEAGQAQAKLLGLIPQALGAVGQWLATPSKTVTPAMPGKPLPIGMKPGTAMPAEDPTQEQHPLLRAAAETAIQSAVEALPDVAMMAGAPGAVRAGLGGLDAGVDAVAGLPGAATRMLVKKALPKPDPELLKVAQMTTDKFGKITVPPDRLHVQGSSAAAAAAQEAGDLVGAGGARIDFDNRMAATHYLARMLNPEETTGRVTPAAVDAARERSGATIDRSYDIAGPQPATAIENALRPELERAHRGAGDAPRVAQARFDEILSKTKEDGTIDPDVLRKWDSDVGRQARQTTDNELAGHLHDMQTVVRNHVEKQLPPADAAALRTARREYAYSVAVEPAVRSGGMVNHGVITDMGALLKIANSSRLGKHLMAVDKGGDLGDLAKAADLVRPRTAAAPDGNVAAVTARHMLYGTLRAGASATVVPPVIGRLYNKHGPAVTKMLVDEGRPPVVPPDVPPPLELAPPGAPIGPGPQGGAPAVPQAPDWETAPGAAPGAIDEVVPGVHRDQSMAPPLDAAGLYEPVVENHEPLPAPTRVGAPDLDAAPPRDAGSQIPAVPGRPDLPDVAVAGPPAEIAATDAQGASMGPALETNRAGAAQAEADVADATARNPEQTGFPDEEPEPAAPEPEPEAAPPAPSTLLPAEQARVAHLDAELAKATNPATKAALQQARARVQKDAAARVKAEGDKAAAADLRAAAARAPDPELAKTLTAQADKLDPPPAAPKPPPAPKPPKAPPPAPPPPAPKPPPPAPAAAAATPEAEPVVADADAEAAASREAQAAAEAADAAPASPPVVDVAGPGPSAVAAPDPVPLPEMPAEEAAPKAPEPMLKAKRPEGQPIGGSPEMQARIDEQKTAEAAHKAAHEDTDGFADGKPSMQRAKVVQTLSAPMTVSSREPNGVYRSMSRRDAIRERVQDGATIQTKEGQRALVLPNGVYLLESALTKTGIDYAEHLLAAKKPPPEPMLKPKDPK